MKTAIDALERMSRMLFNYHHGAPVKVEDLQVELKAALTSLKSLEGRLTVDEAMEVVDNTLRDHHPLPLTVERAVMFALRQALTKSANP